MWRLLDGELLSPFPRWGSRRWEPGWNRAGCALGCADGSAPAEECYCGITVCPTVEDVIRYMRLMTDPPRRVRTVYDVVLGRVEWAGKAQPSPTAMDDPGGTVRVERARLLRLHVGYMPEERRAAAAETLRRRYGVGVDTPTMEPAIELEDPQAQALERLSADQRKAVAVIARALPKFAPPVGERR